jgi:ATP-binding cassette subfamily C exporter for protease/lipase
LRAIVRNNVVSAAVARGAPSCIAYPEQMKNGYLNRASEIERALIRFKSTFLTVGVFSAVANLLMLAPSIYMLQVYDRVLASANEVTLAMLTLMVPGAYMSLSALELIRCLVLVRVGAAFDMQLNKHIYSVSFEHNLKQAGGNAVQSLADLVAVRQFLTGNGVFAFFDAPWFPVCLAVIFFFEPALGWFALGGTALLVLLAYINERVSRRPLAEANSMAVASNTLATNNLRNAELIEAMGMLPNLTGRWFAMHARFLGLQAEASDKAGLVSAITKFVQLSLQSLVLGFGALLVFEGKMSAGMMIAASILVERALAPVQQLIGVYKSFSAARSAWGRLAGLLDANPARASGMPLPKPVGALALEGVSAAPPGSSVAVLKNRGRAVGRAAPAPWPGARDVRRPVGAGAGRAYLLATLRLRAGAGALSSDDVREIGANFSN